MKPVIASRHPLFARFFPVSTIFEEAGFPPLKLSRAALSGSAVRVAREFHAAGVAASARALVRELEVLEVLASVPATDRFWHCSEHAYQQLFETLGAALASSWTDIFALSGWGDATSDSGLIVKLQLPGGRNLRTAFGATPDAPSSPVPAEPGWSVEASEALTTSARLASKEALRWLLALLRAPLRTADRLAAIWPELLVAGALEAMEAKIKLVPGSIYLPVGPSEV